MIIEVKCDHCGKLLRAPDTLAGKKAKCPTCGLVLVVPQAEILDAEIVEPESAAPAAPDLGGLLDDELAYRVAEPEPRPTQSEESRRPCPACGEMIVASAAKCRFCGEIFDAGLRRRESRRGGRRRGDQLASLGSRLGAAILDGLAGMVLILPGFFILSMAEGSGGRSGSDAAAAAGGLLMLGGILVLAVVQLYLLCAQGQTIGKKTLSIRIVKLDDGSNPGFIGAVLMRSFVPGLIGAVPCVGFLFSIADILWIFGEERRCLHDHIAGTIVVEA